MLKTQEIDIRALLEQFEQPLIEAIEAIEVIEPLDEEDPADSFDGVCTQHDSCRSIL